MNITSLAAAAYADELARATNRLNKAEKHLLIFQDGRQPKLVFEGDTKVHARDLGSLKIPHEIQDGKAVVVGEPALEQAKRQKIRLREPKPQTPEERAAAAKVEYAISHGSGFNIPNKILSIPRSIDGLDEALDALRVRHTKTEHYLKVSDDQAFRRLALFVDHFPGDEPYREGRRR